MITSNALLRKIAPLALWSTLGGIPARAQQTAAPAQAPTTASLIRPLTIQGEQTAGEDVEKVLKAIGDQGPVARSLANSADLIAGGFSGWPAGGLQSNPDLFLQVPVEVSLSLDPTLPNAVSTSDWSGFPSAARDPFTSAYARAEGRFFQPPKITGNLAPFESEETAFLGIESLSSAGIRALLVERDKLKDVLLPPPHLANIGESKEFGLGAPMEKLKAAHETKAETAARHKLLEKIALGEFSKEAEPLYPVLNRQMAVSLQKVLSANILTKNWARLPETPQELWAAAYNTLDGGPLPQNPQDEVTRFLASPAGEKARKEFPAVGIALIEKGLKAAYSSVAPEDRAAFYSTVLVDLYGDLREAMGDAQGRSRLGLTASANNGIAFAFHVMHAGEGAPQTRTPDQWKAMAAKVEPEVFYALCQEAIIHHQADALIALLGTEKLPGHALTDAQKATLYAAALQSGAFSSDANELESIRMVHALDEDGADLSKLPPPPTPPTPDPDEEEEHVGPPLKQAALPQLPPGTPFRRAQSEVAPASPVALYK